MPKEHSCPHCDKIFDTKWNLDRHFKRKIKCNANICPHCNYRFSNKINYDYHISHNVCLRKPETMINRLIESKTSTELQLQSDQTRLRIAEIELEQARTLLKIKELEAKKSTPIQDNSIHIEHAENVTINNYNTFGNENTTPLSREVIISITKNPLEGYTGFGIKQLYFNPAFPENQIVQAQNPNARKVKYYNGKQWVYDDKATVAGLLLNGLVSSMERRYREIPAGDKDVDQSHTLHHSYKIDYLEETDNRPKHITKAETTMFKCSSGLLTQATKPQTSKIEILTDDIFDHIQTVQLITFGQENLSGLTPEIMTQISLDPITTIPDLIVRTIYFNPQFPENQIIRAIDPKSKLVQYFDGHQWKTADRDQFSEQLIKYTLGAIAKRSQQITLNSDITDKIQMDISALVFNENTDLTEMEVCVSEYIYDFHQDLSQTYTTVGP